MCHRHTSSYHGEYVLMKPAWNLASDSTTNWICSLGGNNVVLKWKVPSFCPNPLPGITHTPHVSSSSQQYTKSAGLPCTLASPSYALTARAATNSGICTHGKAYMAPY